MRHFFLQQMTGVLYFQIDVRHGAATFGDLTSHSLAAQPVELSIKDPRKSALIRGYEHFASQPVVPRHSAFHSPHSSCSCSHPFSSPAASKASSAASYSSGVILRPMSGSSSALYAGKY